MVRPALLLAALLLAAPAASAEAPPRNWPSQSQRWLPVIPDCTCRAQGRDFRMGETICLRSAAGARLAVCGMALNNSSWNLTDTPCEVSARAE
jgi:hypothetical protein